MEKKYILGIDIGTQSTRCMAFDQDGNIVTVAKSTNPVHENKLGHAEQEVTLWWETTRDVIREVTQQIEPEKIAGLSIAYMRESVAFIDQTGKGLCPAILWYDDRGNDELDELKATIGAERFHEITGKAANKLPVIIKLAWIKNNRPEILKDAWKITDVISYLHWNLTGNLTSVVSGADTTGLLDVSKRAWSKELVEFAGVRMDQLPGLAESGEVVGHVTEGAAESTGLPVGLPIIAGGGDGQVFAVGAGAALGNRFVLNLGTAITGGIQSDKLATSRHFRTDISCLPGKYMYEYYIISGCKLITWYVENFAKEEQELAKTAGKSAETLLEEQIKDIPCGCDGLMTIPYWDGCAIPYNDSRARGLTVGWALHHTKAHFYRSIMEGFAFQLKDFVKALGESIGNLPEVINTGGGGANSSEWCNIISAATNMSIHISESVEGTLQGCFIIAAASLGLYPDMEAASKAVLSLDKVIEPVEENVKRYDEIYENKYKKVYPIFKAGNLDLTDIG